MQYSSSQDSYTPHLPSSKSKEFRNIHIGMSPAVLFLRQMKLETKKETKMKNTWEFRKAKEGKKLYRSIERPNLFKQVIPNSSTTGCDCWSQTLYTLKEAVDWKGQQVWVRTLKEVDDIMQRIAEMDAIQKANEGK